MTLQKPMLSLAGAIASIFFIAGTGTAAAHTTSLGYLPGTGAGEVTFWTGSYSHGSTPVNEGTGTLSGITNLLYSQSKAFYLGPVGTKPTGLMDGTNNFFWPSSGSFPVSTDPGIGGGVAWWQGVTFTGLAPGDYSFTCGNNCGTTAQWRTWAPGAVTVSLTSDNIGGGIPVPEPGALSLFGLGLTGLGFAMWRRRKQLV